jgi:ketosteroid isomerase-like protein
MRYLVTVTAALLLAEVAVAHPQTQGAKAQAAAVAPAARPAAAVVDAFHAALNRGDTQGAAALLANDALIFESGSAERSKAEYAQHHLPADAAFAKAVPSTVTRRSGSSDGTTAWIATEGRTTGTYKGRSLDEVTTETMVLRRVGKAWKIVHIHWSSEKKQ